VLSLKLQRLSYQATKRAHLWLKRHSLLIKNLPFHHFKKAMCRYWLSQYWILRFILSSAITFQQNIASCFRLGHLLISCSFAFMNLVHICWFSCFPCSFCFLSRECLGVSTINNVFFPCPNCKNVFKYLQTTFVFFISHPGVFAVNNTIPLWRLYSLGTDVPTTL